MGKNKSDKSSRDTARSDTAQDMHANSKNMPAGSTKKNKTPK